MAKPKQHNINFTEEEKTGVKAEKLSADTPVKKKTVKPKKEMKQKDNLKFEENKPKLSDKLKENAGDAAKDIPVRTVQNRLHQKIENDSDDNASVDAVNKGTEGAENVNHTVRTYQRRKNRKATDESQTVNREERRQEKTDLRTERKTDRERIRTEYIKRQEKQLADNPEYKSNYYSRWKQKQEIKKEYYAAKAGTSSSATASITSDTVKSAAKKATEDSKKRVIQFVSEHKGATFALLGGVVALLIGLSLVSGGSVLIEGVAGGISGTTYPSEDKEMIDSENFYRSLENGIQVKINDLKTSNRNSYRDRTTTGSSYRYYGDDIYIYIQKDVYHAITIDENYDTVGHDPYELISLLTAKNDYEAFTCNGMKTTMTSIFAQQYTLSSRVTERTSSSTSTSVRAIDQYDADGLYTGYYLQVTETTTTHHYYTLKITLKAKSIDDLAASNLTADQYDMYTIYLETKGNRADLFP